jgi:hypothetical protein
VRKESEGCHSIFSEKIVSFFANADLFLCFRLLAPIYFTAIVGMFFNRIIVLFGLKIVVKWSKFIFHMKPSTAYRVEGWGLQPNKISKGKTTPKA